MLVNLYNIAHFTDRTATSHLAGGNLNSSQKVWTDMREAGVSFSRKLTLSSSMTVCNVPCCLFCFICVRDVLACQARIACHLFFIRVILTSPTLANFSIHFWTLEPNGPMILSTEKSTPNRDIRWHCISTIEK